MGDSAPGSGAVHGSHGVHDRRGSPRGDRGDPPLDRSEGGSDGRDPGGWRRPDAAEVGCERRPPRGPRFGRYAPCTGTPRSLLDAKKCAIFGGPRGALAGHKKCAIFDDALMYVKGPFLPPRCPQRACPWKAPPTHIKHRRAPVFRKFEAAGSLLTAFRDLFRGLGDVASVAPRDVPSGSSADASRCPRVLRIAGLCSCLCDCGTCRSTGSCAHRTTLARDPQALRARTRQRPFAAPCPTARPTAPGTRRGSGRPAAPGP